MAEQTEINFFSQFENETPTIVEEEKNILPTEDTVTIEPLISKEESVTSVTKPPQAEEDTFFSQFEAAPISTKSTVSEEDTFFSQFETKPTTVSTEEIDIPTEEPSWFRKFLYGFDKQDQFFGNVYRIGKAKFQDIKDDNRDLTQVLKDNAGMENQELLNRYQEFKNKKYDSDIYVQAGEMASMLLDPFYLLAYLTPWGRVASASYKGIATIGGATVGLDKLISDYSKTGEFKPSEAILAAGSAAALGPAAMKAFKVIGNYLPGADKEKIAKILGVAENKTADQLGITRKEFKKLNEIVGDKEFITLNNLIKKTGENYSKPFNTLQTGFDKKYNKLTDTIKNIKNINKDKVTKVNENKIIKLEKDKTTLLNEFKKTRKELVKKQSDLLQKETALVNKRDIQILEKLKKSESLSDSAIRYVLTSSTRPLFGAGVGYAFGTLWGSEDDDLNNWIIGGAILGGLQKGINASKVLQVGDKTLASNILNNEAVKLTLQKLRQYTATTTATKLAAFGGKTAEFGGMLLQNLDSPYTKNSVSKVADSIRVSWSNKAVKEFGRYNETQGANVLNSLRGSKIKLTTQEKILKRNITTYMNDFKNLYNEAGIFSKENIKNYFPRVYNFDKIQKNPKQFEEVLVQIFKNKKAKDPVAEAKEFANTLNDVSNFNIVKSNIDDLINSNKISKEYIITPLSNHINKQRQLTGNFNQVEKLLSDNGFLVNKPIDVLTSLVNRSANSIAFSQRFGANGEFLTPFYQGIKTKYKNTGKDNWRQLAKTEIEVFNNTIEGYFDRFGQAGRNQLKATAGLLSTIANLNMLDRVTIASLGDLIQPFTNSTNWSTWFKSLGRTALTAKRETDVAKNMGLAQMNEIKISLQKPLAIQGDEIAAHASWIGSGKPLTKANNIFFKISGLEWLTGFARRFAYNAGAIDAYTTSNKLAKFVSAGGKINSSKGANFVKDLERYGISLKDALKIGSNSYDEAVKTTIGKKNLNDAGILAANRDAIIPQVSNRLLFTQSNTPWVRLMGQFLSWSMAKSAQTNKILSRIENGDTRTMVKLLAALPIYGGIQELRELAKYGEVITDIKTDADDWWSEAIRLSGLPGVAPEFLANTIVGPGSRQPFFLAFPAGSLVYEADKIAKDALKGNTDRATERFFQRIVPLPTWRKFILERAKDLGVDLTDTIFDYSQNKKLPKTTFERKPFFEGDIVEQDIDTVNIESIPTGKLSSTIINKGVTAELLNEPIIKQEEMVNENKPILPTEKPIKSQMDKLIEPKKKPVEMQMDKLMTPKEKSIVVKEDVVYSLPKNVDMKFLEEVEGNKNKIYVPTSKGKVIGNSGPTIGMGFDVGSRNENDLRGLPTEIIKKLKPYLGLKGQEALDYINKNPLQINNEEKNIINAFAKKGEMEKLRKKWKETTGKSFDDLDTKAATTIASVAFQNGDLSRKAPKFWKQVTNEDWSGAFYNLLDWDDTGKPSQTQKRREKEAKLLKGLFEGDK
jgi:GH24 family phage-related lysozyme (muramidase)